MIITKVEAIPINLPLLRPNVTALGTITHSRKVLVKISTDESITGYGEASVYPEYGGGSKELITVSLLACNKYLVGESPLDIQYIHAKLRRSGVHVPIATAAIDVALHDLLGKSFKLPLHALLGGRLRDQVDVFFILAGETPRQVAEDAVRARIAGYKTVKVKAGFEPIDFTLKKIRAIREATSDDLSITVDANQAWEVKEAIAGIRKMAALDVQSVEQPVAGRDLDGMAAVTRSSDVSIVADESIWNMHDALEIIKRRAADVLSVRISKAGGLSEARSILELAYAEGMPCILGSTLESSLGIAAALQLGVTARCRLYASALSHHLMYVSPLIQQPLTVDGGSVIVPPGIGLGVEVNEQAVNAFRDMQDASER